MMVMGPSPVAALDASYQSGRDIGRSGVGLNVQKNVTPGDQERRPEEDNVGEPGVRRRGDGGRHQPVGTSVEMVWDGSGVDLLLRMARGADQQLR
jgi:hypothetical protein